jgi:two-component system, OmpR family, sensor kinase
MLHAVGRWWNNRKLVGKHSLLLLSAALLITPVTQFALGALLQPAFERIEKQGVQDQKARVKHALSEFETSLQNATLDYAVWDDMYDYAEDRNPGFEHETLSPISHMNNAIDYRGIVRMDGTVIWSSEVDLSKVKLLPAESEAMKAVLTESAFFQRATTEKKTITYVRAKRGVYLLTTALIVKSDESGAPRGFIVNGVLLNKKSLSDTLQVNVTLNLAPSTDAAAAVIDAPGNAVSTIGKSATTTKIGLFGLRKDLLATVDFATARSITAAGSSAILSASIAVVLAILALVALLSIGLRQITVRRLQMLEIYVRNFRTGGVVLQPNLTVGSDEIASLANQFQTLSEQLGEAEEQLQQRSYLQGKADSAAGMLHNVRNALAPVRVMHEKWLRDETLPYRTNMQKAVAELSKPDIDAARRNSLEQFLVTAARTIAVSSDGRLLEMEEVKASIDQIAEILGSYNFDTSSTNAGDEIDFAQVARQQFKVLSARDVDPIEFAMPDAMPTVLGNRVHLGQVLGNIFVNAHEAMVAANASPMQIVIAWDIAVKSDQVMIRISDNGDGIAAGNIDQVFQRGYSTRNHKAGGLGMHWSANAMRAMGGGITLESDGAGQGTTVILTLKAAKIDDVLKAA